jgi:hypothetical protein
MLVCSPTPPEVLCPSGDVTAGVRFARDYHPRHLPPLAFLRPPTVYSSKQLVCLVSYRHHLIGFKEHERHVAFLAVLTGPSWGQSRPGSQGSDTLTTRRRPHGSAACLQRRPAPADETFASCNVSAVSLTESAASNRYGRRAHRHTRRSRLTTSCPFVQCANMSLTESAASNRYGRRTR